MQPDDGVNRSMPLESLCCNLSARTGVDVAPTNLHHAMHDTFGDFASATSLKSLGVLDKLKEKMYPEREGGETRGRGLGDGLLNIAAAVRDLSKSQTQ